MSGFLSILRRVILSSAMSVLFCAPCAAQTVPSPPAASGPPPIGSVFKEVPRDLWRYISWDTAAVLGVGGGAALVGHIWDDDLAGEIETNASLNNAMEPGHTYGAFAFQALVGIGLYSGGWIAKNNRLAVTGADIMRAQLLGQAYVQALKFTVQRERPDKSNNVSFPSGHSASAFATAGVLQRHYGWKVGVPATLAAGYVAMARVHDNKHYLSDVIFGGAMGIAAQRTVTLRSGRYGMTLAPRIDRGTTGALVIVTTR
jgi:hypothetical protein